MTPTLSGFRSHGIREPLTKRIAGILDEYPDGTQIARELLQNSDDARSKFQWYLLDHRHHFRHQVDGPKLFHENLREYMGPALLAGSDSLFEENDFKSMKNLADSEKKSDETKIGQMGIGFNSIYHMTDCPSFISGDQFMVIEPHERIFNGVNSTFTEGAVRGNFVDNTVGLELFPDQLKTFAVLEDIDFTKPYPGTIFRFPLRTNEQAQESRLSKNAYPAEKVLEMLAKLKNEALRGILFLKHIERIEIYEIKEGQRQPSKIFQIEIVNAKEVRKERKHLLANLKPHVYPDPSSSRDAILEYSVRPIFKLTQEDGTVTEETWHITTMVGNVLTAHEYMAEETGGVLSNHKLIPWVGIGAPAEPGTKIDSSRLFCFLPIGIQLPFPVHVNGHFAVKQSRREIWTNQDKDFSSDSSANIKSVWNIHLFQSHIPVVYAKFLNTLGLARGPSYDLWPVSCGQGLGLDAIWKNLLTDTLQVVCDDNLPVFFCKDGGPSEYRVVDYQSSWIAGRDIDGYHLLLDALQNLVNVVAGLPDPILNAIPGVVEPLDLDNRILTPTLVRDLLREHKRRWSSVVSNETKVEMLKYCIEDNDIADLEGLPLLPLAGNQWVEFDVDKSNSRYLVSQEIFKVLSLADDGLVDINIDPVLVEKFRSDDAFKIFWSKMKCSTLASRVKNMYQRLYYETSGNVVRSLDPIAQPSVFPTKNWTIHFWEMVFSLSQAKRKRLLSLLEGIHVLPVTQERLAPLSRDLPVVYLDRMKHEKDQTLVDFLNVLECQLGYRVLRSDAFITDAIAEGYVFEVSDAVMVIQVLSKVDQSKLYDLGQNLREIICGFMAKWLPVDQVLNDVNLRTLRSLPIYRLYEASTLVSLEAPETGMSAPKWRVAWRFTSADYPWLPTAFKLLADGQPMGQHLTKTIKIQAIKESEYWFSVISNLLHYPEDDWDSIMEKMCIMYHIHKQEHDFASVMRDLPFVRTTGPEQSGEESGPRRPPLSIVHPDLSLYYMAHEDVFPVGVYSQAPVFGVLDEMGMRSKFDAPLILDRVRILSSQDGNIGDGNNNCNLEARTDALRALYAQMNIDFTNGFATHEMQSTLRSRSWILATSLSDTNQRLCTVQESRPRSDAVLIGDQMPMSIFDFNNRFLIRCLGWDHSPPLDHVLAHFLTMIDRFRVEAMSDEDVPSFNKIYNYLLEKMEVHSNLVVMKETLADLPWIAISGSLHPVDRVALKLRCDLAPHFVQVTTSDIKLNKLFLAMGVRETVGQADLQGLISTVANRYGEGDSITEADSDFVVKILLAMTGPDVKFRWSADLLIPTTANLLCKIEDVVYDDVGAQMRLKSGDGSKPPPYKFTSSKIAKSTAQKLLISMVSTRSWNDQKDSTFVPWAQEENILDRIGSILNDYHPSSIFTEFLQNAEDAGATKCCFMLDQTRYDKGKTLSAEMDVWQGPALVIYNDAEFTENDFVALSHISVGSKRDDPTKIGRHGLGFNSVYHFTDVPSIVSGSYLGFFDPHHQYLPKKQTPHGLVAEGGQRCQFAKLDNDMFSNQLAPYRGLFECDMETHFKGTIFRIPLRTADTSQDNGQDKAIARVWTVEEVDSMLRNWARDARVGMVFLENVKTIEIQDNAREKASFRWSATKTAGCSKQMHRVLNEQQSESGAETCVIDISATRMDTMKWLVHTEPNFPVDTASDIKDLAQKNRWHSHRGVAIPLNFNYKQGPFLGRMFTHLPTPIHTGLPFHIHGVFALMSNRKGLAGGTDEVDPMWKWNHFMMEKILPLTSANAFEKLLKWMFRAEVQTNGGLKHKEIEHIIAEYFKFWPFKSKNEGAQGQNHVGVFTKQFIRLSYDHPIFPCRSASSVPIEGKKGQEVTFTGTSLSSVPGSLDRAIRGRLQQMKINVCDCSERVEVQIEADWKSSKGSSALTYRYINPDLIRRLIRQDPGFIPKSAKTIEEKRWILDFALGVVLDPKAYAAITEPLSGLALIPLVNGEWKELQNESLLPTVYYVAKPAMKELIRGEDVLVDESLFKSVKDQKSSGETTVITSLERILTRLINDTPYCIKEMPPEKFADVICAENPDGIAISIRDKTVEGCFSWIGGFLDSRLEH
ncbi:hypothetical protein B0O80DRAFT_221440 [Mortierella sp. GBAus27b]|nr:hypothetical protein B0O80DRAFT_221440 [Mortierella sp. GBAus27b]